MTTSRNLKEFYPIYYVNMKILRRCSKIQTTLQSLDTESTQQTIQPVVQTTKCSKFQNDSATIYSLEISECPGLN